MTDAFKLENPMAAKHIQDVCTKPGSKWECVGTDGLARYRDAKKEHVMLSSKSELHSWLRKVSEVDMLSSVGSSQVQRC